MKRWGRSLSVFLRLVPFVLAFLRDRRRFLLLGRAPSRSVNHHEKRALRLASVIASLGPTFIKLAQLLSARADIFPEPYLSAISTLQDQVPPDPVDEIVAVMERELGKSASELFDSFEREPIAAASLGQVHEAVVDGRSVVVKVLRPNVEEIVALDLDISFRLLFWLNILFPNHHVRALTNVVREFSHKVREEMDFRMEAEHIRRFRETFGGEVGVRAPEVIEDFTRQRVLVMEKVEGLCHFTLEQIEDRIETAGSAFQLRSFLEDSLRYPEEYLSELSAFIDEVHVVREHGPPLNIDADIPIRGRKLLDTFPTEEQCRRLHDERSRERREQQEARLKAIREDHRKAASIEKWGKIGNRVFDEILKPIVEAYLNPRKPETAKTAKN